MIQRPRLAILVLLTVSIAATAGAIEIPTIDSTGLEPVVAEELRLLEEAARRQPTDPDALGNLARHYHSYGFEQRAIDLYVESARLAPSNPVWPYLEGAALESLGRTPEAIERLQVARGLAPEEVAIRLRLASLFRLAGDFGKAQEEVDRAIAIAPEEPAVRLLAGEVALDRREWTAAISHLEAALAAVPEASRIHHLLGRAWRGLGAADRARSAFEKAGPIGIVAANDPVRLLEELRTGERVLLQRGKRAYRAGDLPGALREFRQAVDAAPNSARARIDLAVVLTDLGRLEDAEAELERAVELAPENARARANLGQLLLHRNETAGAVRALLKAVELDPDDGITQRLLAELGLRSGRPADGLPYARRAAELMPQDPAVRSILIATLDQLEQHEEVMTELERARRDFPEDRGVQATLARLLATSPSLQSRQGALALELALELFETGKTATDAVTVAMAHAELGRCSDAREWLVRAKGLADSPEEEAEIGGRIEGFPADGPCRP